MASELDFSDSDTPTPAKHGGGLLKPLALIALVGATVAAVGVAVVMQVNKRNNRSDAVTQAMGLSDDDEIRSLEAMHIAKSHANAMEYVNKIWEIDFRLEKCLVTGKNHAIELDNTARRLEADHVKKYSVKHRSLKELSPDRWFELGKLDKEASRRVDTALSGEFHLRDLVRINKGDPRGVDSPSYVSEDKISKYYNDNIADVDAAFSHVRFAMSIKPIH